jgi:hypothetical protein
MTRTEIAQAMLSTIKTARMNLEHARDLHYMQMKSAPDKSQSMDENIGAAILSCLVSAQVSMERMHGIQKMAQRIYPGYPKMTRTRLTAEK